MLISTGPSLQQPHGAAGQQPPAMLTNDPLAVETHLQSRVHLLEEEKVTLINRMVELEKELVQHKEEGKTQVQTLTAQHNQSLLQVSVYLCAA